MRKRFHVILLERCAFRRTICSLPIDVPFRNKYPPKVKSSHPPSFPTHLYLLRQPEHVYTASRGARVSESASNLNHNQERDRIQTECMTSQANIFLRRTVTDSKSVYAKSFVRSGCPLACFVLFFCLPTRKADIYCCACAEYTWSSAARECRAYANDHADTWRDAGVVGWRLGWGKVSGQWVGGGGQEKRKTPIEKKTQHTTIGTPVQVYPDVLLWLIVSVAIPNSTHVIYQCHWYEDRSKTNTREPDKNAPFRSITCARASLQRVCP